MKMKNEVAAQMVVCFAGYGIASGRV
jgi:hypothetical protein